MSSILALSAAAALFKFIELSAKFFFTPNTIKLMLEQQDEKNLTQIDFNTCRYLELVYNTRHINSKNSLCSIVNYTETKNGLKKLRSTVLQPPYGKKK
jgi:DNA mismatch repair ATPase MutS